MCSCFLLVFWVARTSGVQGFDGGAGDREYEQGGPGRREDYLIYKYRSRRAFL